MRWMEDSEYNSFEEFCYKQEERSRVVARGEKVNKGFFVCVCFMFLFAS